MADPADLPVPATSGEEVRAVVTEVLARPEFTEARPSLVDRLWTALLRLIAELLEVLGGGGRGTVIGTLLLVLATAVAVWLAVRLTRQVRRSGRAREATVELRGRSGDDWRAEAAQHEAAGDWRQAVRSAYRALVADLAAAGLVEEAPGRTTGELRAEVAAAAPDAGPAFARATAVFEAAWYGHAAVGSADLVALQAAAGAVLADAGLRLRAAAA